MRSHLAFLFAAATIASASLVQAQSASAFFDRNRPADERMQAIQQLGYPDDKTKDALFAIAGNKSESDAIRWEALRRLQYSPRYRDLVLRILGDPADGGEFLDANLIRDLSRKTAFRLPIEDQQRIQIIERPLLSDNRPRVRLEAYRALVSNHDSVALGRLTQTLRTGINVPIPLTDAIELLDDDGSVQYIGILRPYLLHADAAVRARAVRALALDEESRPRIVEMATSAQSPTEVRVNALRGLAREDRAYLEYAVPIVANGQENPEIRQTAMHHIVGRLNYNNTDPAEQIRFAQVVERVSLDRSLLGNEAGLRLKNEATQVLAYLKKAFPAIGKFYANR